MYTGTIILCYTMYEKVVETKEMFEFQTSVSHSQTHI